VPAYFSDPIVRRSPPLQKTKDAQAPKAWMNGRLMARLGIAKASYVLAKHAGGSAKLVAALDERLPDECVRIAAAHPASAELGPMFGTLLLEKVATERAA
jgi:NADH-quinone oxidoreductase subunit G